MSSSAFLELIQILEEESLALRRALFEAQSFLRNDRYKTRVHNALATIDDALEQYPYDEEPTDETFR